MQIINKILKDQKNEKTIEWQKYKINSLPLSDSYLRISNKNNFKFFKNYYLNKSLRVKDCGTFLTFKEFIDNSLKLYSANFCQVRLCPMCAWRRSLKIFGQVSRIMDYFENNFEYRYIFLTLTVENVSSDLLSNELDHLFKSFILLTKRKEFRNISNGWFRCLEITHNWERNDYHPHFHVIIAVNKSYFKKSNQYLTQKQWAKLWQSCLKADYIPLVDVRVVKPDINNNKSYKTSIAEVAKYAVKYNDYILTVKDQKNKDLKNYSEDKTDEVVEILDKVLQNRRLVAFGGKFKEIHKKLNLDDSIDGDLIHTDNENELRNDLSYTLVRYQWNVGFQNYLKIIDY